MLKSLVFFAFLAVAFADPEPKAKPGVLAAAYTAPVVAAAAPVAYTAPLTYSASYVGAPLAYSAYPSYSPYSAYSAYTAPIAIL